MPPSPPLSPTPSPPPSQAHMRPSAAGPSHADAVLRERAFAAATAAPAAAADVACLEAGGERLLLGFAIIFSQILSSPMSSSPSVQAPTAGGSNAVDTLARMSSISC
jgi:hypothetical protein